MKTYGAGKEKLGRKRNKKAAQRLSLKENEVLSGEGGGLVVKGVSRRVIVVKSPDERIFEEAIFIIREDYASRTGVNEKDVLREARKAANAYLREGNRGTASLQWLKAPIYAMAGAAATGIAWLAVQLVH